MGFRVPLKWRMLLVIKVEGLLSTLTRKEYEYILNFHVLSHVPYSSLSDEATLSCMILILIFFILLTILVFYPLFSPAWYLGKYLLLFLLVFLLVFSIGGFSDSSMNLIHLKLVIFDSCICLVILNLAHIRPTPLLKINKYYCC